VGLVVGACPGGGRRSGAVGEPDGGAVRGAVVGRGLLTRLPAGAVRGAAVRGEWLASLLIGSARGASGRTVVAAAARRNALPRRRACSRGASRHRAWRRSRPHQPGLRGPHGLRTREIGRQWSRQAHAPRLEAGRGDPGRESDDAGSSWSQGLGRLIEGSVAPSTRPRRRVVVASAPASRHCGPLSTTGTADGVQGPTTPTVAVPAVTSAGRSPRHGSVGRPFSVLHPRAGSVDRPAAWRCSTALGRVCRASSGGRGR